jgi:triphosphoribosyl-dephospho-CoA synthetase
MSSRAARAAAAAHSVNPRHLTAATKQQIQSRGDRANSGVRNVYRDKKRWRAQITERGIAVHIGTFDSVGEADAAVRKFLARISVSLSVALGAPASQPEAQLGWERQCAGSPGGRS